jgi:site-specific DNA-methyltransferase (adenine-specific)
VLDPFTGSGTTLAVAKKLGRSYIGFELSEEYAARAQQRLGSIAVGQPLDGVENPLTSVPSTAEGTRLDERTDRGAKTKTRKLSDRRQKELL